MTVNTFAAYDGPELLRQISHETKPGERELLLHVDGIHCGACVRRIEEALREHVIRVRADVPSSSCEIRWNPDRFRLSDILQRIDALGFTPQVLPDDGKFQDVQQQRRSELVRIGLALLFGMQVMMLASAEYFGEVHPEYQALLRYAQWLLATPVAMYAGWPLLLAGYRALWQRSVTMDTPVAIAITAAYSLSAWNTLSGQGHVYFDSVVMFVLLLSLARYFQQSGQRQAAERLRWLMSAQPVMAIRVHPEGQGEVPVSALVKGDRIVVPPGQAVAADGYLLDAAELDESLLTGEAIPQSHEQGDKVLAGSVNLGLRAIEVQVEAVGSHTVLSQIARLVQRAQLERPKFDTAVERVARHFVSLVLVLAGLAIFVWRADMQQAVEAALAVLVVTCPCALSLAVPTSLAAAMSRLARQSVLLVHTDVLLRLGKLSDVCLDKTGTLTTRAMRIAKLETAAELSEAECRRIAARLETGLEHPIARAFFQGHSVQPADEVELRPGEGVFGLVDGHAMSLQALLDKQSGHKSSDPFQRWFVLRDGERDLAYFALEEELRPGVRPMIQGLQSQGLAVHLLSGDSSGSAPELASYIGADSVHHAQTPQGKLDYMRGLQAQGRRVLAVGDGINDGPLLAGADAAIGLASGAALAQAHGDAILMSADVRGISCLLAVGKRARRIILQNFVWAIGYNVTMVPLAFMGLITPWLAALGMGGSSLLVTLNALRLLNTPDPYRCAPEDPVEGPAHG